ncbi:MAG: hypothetical protein L0338_26835 [Acidobacteria bacterium]|nr:hypothetical protein [Verrucomicrobiales bacterium]MCI0722557.1 hypothetical protein [Acidobacteriota bacterium]
MREPLVRLLTELNAEALDIRTGFGDLFHADLDTFPIPFFGDLRCAKVITVGLNPSDGEIRGRGWPRPLDVQTIVRRLSNYFISPQFPPHSWFNRWEEALGKIGVSYLDGTAAHIDLCPWPTRPMENLSDQTRFQRLVLRGLPSFWRCVQLAAGLRLMMMAGAVNK